MTIPERYTQEEHPIGERPAFKDYETYWKDTFLKMLKEEVEILKKLPGNTYAIDKIRQLKQILYQWFLIDPEELWFCKTQGKKSEQLELNFE